MKKRIFWGVILGGSLLATIVLAAPSSTILQNIYPSANNTYDLGTPTRYWKNAYINTLTATSSLLSVVTSTTFCLGADCRTAWPGGGSGTPGGSTTELQFNNGGEFLGDPNLTWSSSTQILAITGILLSNGNINVFYPNSIYFDPSGNSFIASFDDLGTGMVIGGLYSTTTLYLQNNNTSKSAILSTDNITDDRTFSFPDKAGTFAMTSDIGSSFTTSTLAGLEDIVWLLQGSGISIATTTSPSTITLINDAPNYNTTTSLNGLTGTISGLSLFNTTTSLAAGAGINVSGATGNVTITNSAPNYNTTTSINTLTGAITGASLWNTTTSLNGLSGAITNLNLFNTTNTLNFFSGSNASSGLVVSGNALFLGLGGNAAQTCGGTDKVSSISATGTIVCAEDIQGSGTFTTTTINGLSSTEYLFTASSGITIATTSPGYISIQNTAPNFNTTTSINGLTGAISNLNIYNTTTSINTLTGAITGASLWNTTTTIGGVQAASFALTASSGLAIATTTSGIINIKNNAPNYNTTTTINGASGAVTGVIFGLATTTIGGVQSASFALTASSGLTFATTTTGTININNTKPNNNTTTSINTLTGAITNAVIWNTTTSINTLTGAITGASLWNTTSTGGAYLTETGSVIALDPEIATGTIAFGTGNQAPAVGDAWKIRAPVALTIYEIGCAVNTATASVEAEERGAATPYSAGTDIYAGTIACDSDTQSTTTFSNASIAKDAWIYLNVTATTTAQTDLTGWVNFFKND